MSAIDNYLLCGGQDSLLHILSINNSLGCIEPSGIPSISHNHWVTSSLVTKLNNQADTIFISGCMDGNIYIADSNGIKIGSLEGHKKGVISLGLAPGNKLLSGSWDGTARLWNLETHSCEGEFGPHENGVHVLYIDEGIFATIRCNSFILITIIIYLFFTFLIFISLIIIF